MRPSTFSNQGMVSDVCVDDENEYHGEKIHAQIVEMYVSFLQSFGPTESALWNILSLDNSVIKLNTPQIKTNAIQIKLSNY